MTQQQSTNETTADLVVVPSIDVSENPTNLVTREEYEQRSLCQLLHLRETSKHIYFVTSKTVSQASIDYVLGLLPGVEANEARLRLHMYSCDHDTSNKSLSEKLLGSPELIQQIRTRLKPHQSQFLCHMYTKLEESVATALGLTHARIPDGVSNLWGSKHGSRLCFETIGIPHPRGSNRNLCSMDDVLDELILMCSKHPEIRKVLLKLNEGCSGSGSAELVLPCNRSSISKESLRKYLMLELVPCRGGTASDFLNRVPERGAVVEEMIEHQQLASPSVQGVISDQGSSIEIISTNEKLLAHQDDQGYCFPASEVCRARVLNYGTLVGEHLASKGVKGEFSVEFVTWVETQEDGSSSTCIAAIEIKLGHVGTAAHPTQMLKLLTGGQLVADSNVFMDQKGDPKYYLSTDCFREANGISTEQFVQLTVQYSEQLQFCSSTNSGPVFYNLDCLQTHGKIGMMYISNTEYGAQSGFQKVKLFVRSLMQDKTQKLRSPLSTLSTSVTEVRLCRPGMRVEGESKLPMGVPLRKVLITVAVHGNEQCGLRAVRALEDTGFFSTAAGFWERFPGIEELVIAIGNPKAVEENKRFLNSNLNRVVTEPVLTPESDYEHSLVPRVRALIDNCTWYLDLHSTSASSKPFALPANNEASKLVAESLGVEFVLEKIYQSLSGTTLHWGAQDESKVCVVVECGQHLWNSSVAVARDTILRFLSLASDFGRTVPVDSFHDFEVNAVPKSHAHQVLMCDERQPLNQGFQYVGRPLKAFEYVPFGKLLAKDDQGEIRCPFEEGAYIIMPTAAIVVGEEAWFWGRAVN